ncbi:MAG: hypothetical protein WCT26_03265 [Candidatus Buchananbacteria bacterium]|jgi:hypothetical protein
MPKFEKPPLSNKQTEEAFAVQGDPEKITKEGVEALSPDFFDKFSLAMTIRHKLAYEQDRAEADNLRQQFNAIGQYLGDEVKTHIKTNEQLSDLIDHVLEKCDADKLVKEDGKVIEIRHENSFDYTWRVIHEIAFKDATLDQLALIDKKFHYISKFIEGELWLKVRSGFSDEITWDVLRDRLLDGCNSLHLSIDEGYRDWPDIVTSEKYLRYLRMISDVISEKPELEGKILRSLWISEKAKKDLGREPKDAELISYLENRKKQAKEMRKS